jgi:hypothetical protein
MGDEITSKLNVAVVVSLADPAVRSRVSISASTCASSDGGRSRRFAEGRCQQMWPIIKQLGAKGEQGGRSRGELDLVLRCEFAEGQVRGHK